MAPNISKCFDSLVMNRKKIVCHPKTRYINLEDAHHNFNFQHNIFVCVLTFKPIWLFITLYSLASYMRNLLYRKNHSRELLKLKKWNIFNFSILYLETQMSYRMVIFKNWIWVLFSIKSIKIYLMNLVSF